MPGKKKILGVSPSRRPTTFDSLMLFSYQAMQSNDTPRRRFLEWGVWGILGTIGAALASVLGAAVILPALEQRGKRSFVLGELEKLSPTPQRFDLVFEESQGWWSERRSEAYYAARDAGGKIVVMSSVCSHLGCTVRWEEKSRHFICPCHGGIYDDGGQVVSGPPPAPLKRLEVTTDDKYFRIERV